MPEIILNDEAMEAESGEQLLAVARRKGAHVWFACDGRGLCRTCECQILEGSESLNPPTSLESDALSEERLRNGYRLACQTIIHGDGPVRALSQAEWIRRRMLGIIKPDSAVDAFDALSTLSSAMMAEFLDFGKAMPAILLNLIPNLMESPPTLDAAKKYLKDASRILEQLISPDTK